MAKKLLKTDKNNLRRANINYLKDLLGRFEK